MLQKKHAYIQQDCSEAADHSLTIANLLKFMRLGQLLQRLAAVQPGMAIVQQPELELPGSFIICSRQICSSLQLSVLADAHHADAE